LLLATSITHLLIELCPIAMISKQGQPNLLHW